MLTALLYKHSFTDTICFMSMISTQTLDIRFRDILFSFQLCLCKKCLFEA